MKLIDLRTIKPLIFNQKSIKKHFGIGYLHQVFHGEDGIAYKLFLQHGDKYLRRLNGEFAYVYYDQQLKKIFATRDWIGEVPLHYAIIGNCIVFANFISDLLRKLPSLKYDEIVAVNRSEVVEIDIETVKIKKHLYYNFNKEKNRANYSKLSNVAKDVHDLLFEAVEARLPKSSQRTALLLSGGIDSMSIAYVASVFNPNITAYTIEVASQQSTDLIRAQEITKAFGLHHKIVNVSEIEILESVTKAVTDCEIYHMYNVFCAVGMHKLADVLKNDGIAYVFTGEGGNEAFGDYHDWIVIDPKTKKKVILQKTSKDFNEPAGREAYIWGNLTAESKGKYNIQLGSGLGKHGGSRMYKPMFKRDIYLLSPYFEKAIMKIIANIPSNILDKVGGKSGFMKLVFAKEVETGKIPEKFFDVNKIRFQDASEGGEGGITGTLLSSGYNQQKIIDIFNEVFRANIKPLAHLRKTVLIK